MKTLMLAALAASLAIPSFALAASLAPANSITVLNAVGGKTPIVGDLNDPPINGASFEKITFVNNSDTPATDVEFTVGPAETPLHDVGTFSKGVVVSHTFFGVGDTGYKVSVIDVRYADGSEWSENGQQPLVRRQATYIAPLIPVLGPNHEN
jgi:hypothetical protein